MTADGRLASPDRVVALSDGVFAIVITILVLEIAVPANLSEASLRSMLDELRPTIVAWVVSFLITGMYWVVHRDLFARVRRVNRDLIWLNLLFLLPCCLIPFAASVLGEYPDESVAVQLYVAVLVAAGLMRTLLYRYVIHRPHLMWEPAVDPRARLALALAAAPIPLYLIAGVVAEASTTASVVILFFVPGLYFLLISVLRERPATQAEAEEFS